MAWQVALLLDAETEVNVAVGQMPIWALATEQRHVYAPEWRNSWDSMWYPDPGFTLVNIPAESDLVEWAVKFIPTLEEHHPNLFCLHLFGVDQSARLNSAMAEQGFFPGSVNKLDGLTFTRPFEQFAQELVLDAAGWNTKGEWFWAQDFYTAFFKAVGAPEWHGRNLDALNDSVAGGGINKIEVPYRITVCNVSREHESVKNALDDFITVIGHLQAEGCPISIRVAD